MTAKKANKTRTVHFTWNESLNPKYPQVLEYREQWISSGFTAKVTPNANIRLDIVKLDSVLNRTDLTPKFDGLETDNMRYDFWRYTKLYLEGGVYSDVDVLPGEHLLDWYQESQDSGKPVFFEASTWPHTPFYEFVIPLVSDYQVLPAIDTCLVISAQPRSDVLIKLLDTMDPAKWKDSPEPRKTLMSVGPGIVSEFVKSHHGDDVTRVDHWDRKLAYQHKGFGTWKSGRSKEIEYLYRLSAILLFVALAARHKVIRSLSRQCLGSPLGSSAGLPTQGEIMSRKGA